jgi:hypothetical protein
MPSNAPTPSERREIIPRDRRRGPIVLTLGPYDRREVYTYLDCFCRCYHTALALSRYRSRCRLWPDDPEDA